MKHPNWVSETLHEGVVIPAHPLALTAKGKFDEVHQRALTRYYHASGAGGLAVGVHTTQFEIRQHGLLEPVLTLAAETARTCDAQTNRQTILVNGIVGRTPQAIQEATLAKDLGYHAGLLSLSAFKDASTEEMVAHCIEVAEVMPLIGFYLQPSVGGRLLPQAFWEKFAEIPNVIGIKIAPFNRYQTLDVLRGVAASSRWAEIAIYTGNDDNIVHDLTNSFEIVTPSGTRSLHFSGGLLGHWACWTSKAVGLLEACKQARKSGQLNADLLVLANQVTESNAALFDAAHAFEGCIAGIHAVLYQQGLLSNMRCLNPNEGLSEGQADEIARIYAAYPHLTDDAFVAEHLDEWLK
jgi:hypothetical protein